MNLSPAVLFCRGMRCKSDTPPHTPTKHHRYNAFRARSNSIPVNSYPWKHLRTPAPQN